MPGAAVAFGALENCSTPVPAVSVCVADDGGIGANVSGACARDS